MRKYAVLAGSLLVGAAPLVYAQAGTQPRPTTAAAQCRLDAVAYQSKKFSELRAAGQMLSSDVTAPILAEGRRMARGCAKQIAPGGASPAELTALASLYLFTADTTEARNAIGLVLAKQGMTEVERADAFLAAEQLAIATFDPFAGINPDGEHFVRAVDEMSDAVIRQKVRAHELLLGRYEYADIDDGLRDHARKLLDVAKRALRTNALGMTPATAGSPSVDAAYPVMTSAYSSLARGEGDFLHADSALLILDEAERVLGPVYPNEHNWLDGQRELYRLVGTRATPIDGKWWINGTDGSSLVPGNAKVTLIQFTAHWCVPCKNSYPGMMHMTEHFAGTAFEAVMETYLYGFIGDKQKLTPDEEVAADRDYYVKHNGLSLKIAINPSLARGDTLTKDNQRRYAVGGIPEIVVVDRRGIIRATVSGWDSGNEKRLTALIATLLAEK